MIVPILMYHSISKDKSNLSISPKNFEKQINFLHKLGYKTINFDDIGKKIQKSIIITFDDGYKDNLINALPILKKYNFTSTCFVVSDLIGSSNIWDVNYKNYVYKELLTKNDLKEWKNYGMSIGSHGKSHKSLIKLNSNQMYDEIFNSKKDIENSIGSKVEAFSYPFGHINKISVEYVKEIYDFAVTTIRSRFNTSKHKLYYIPRIHMSDNLTTIKLYLKLKTFYEDIKYNEKQLYL